MKIKYLIELDENTIVESIDFLYISFISTRISDNLKNLFAGEFTQNVVYKLDVLKKTIEICKKEIDNIEVILVDDVFKYYPHYNNLNLFYIIDVLYQYLSKINLTDIIVQINSDRTIIVNNIIVNKPFIDFSEGLMKDTCFLHTDNKYYLLDQYLNLNSCAEEHIKTNFLTVLLYTVDLESLNFMLFKIKEALQQSAQYVQVNFQKKTVECEFRNLKTLQLPTICKCFKKLSTSEKHICLYQADINENKNYYCNCCSNCEQECANDI